MRGERNDRKDVEKTRESRGGQEEESDRRSVSILSFCLLNCNHE